MYENAADTRLFAELYDVQPQAIFWLSPIWADGHIIDFAYSYANEEGLHYLNISRNAFQGLTVNNTRALNNDLRQAVLEELKQVYTTGQKASGQVYNAALNKYAKVLRAKVRDGVLSVILDVTEEQRTIRQLEEQADQLQEQKSLLDSILHNSSNGISVSKMYRDESGTVIDALTIMANDAAVKYIGLPREVYLTKRATELEPGIIGSAYYRQCIHTLETGEPFVTQYRTESTGRWLELTVSRLDRDHLIHIFSDVTPVKEVQLQLENTAATLRSVFNSAQTGLFTLVPISDHAGAITDFRFVMVNKALAAFVKQEPEQLEGELYSRWFPHYQGNGSFERYRTCFETGEAQQWETHYTAEGFDNYMDLHCVRTGTVLLVSFTDFTTLRKSQLELEQTITALKRSNVHLEDFAHAASHDMKEPLRKILTFADRLKATLEPQMSDTEKIYFSRIEAAASRMQLLVDDLLEFSHVSEKPQATEAINLEEKVRKVITDLELPIEEKRATVQVGKLPTVRGNRRQLQQLFQNLISNAIKYSRPGVPPVITLEATRITGQEAPIALPAAQLTESFHLIRVTDNGIGFEPQYREQIFEMFQRLHGKAEYSGTGVGLSIARKVVENHGGAIWADSDLGKGATFSILLPA